MNLRVDAVTRISTILPTFLAPNSTCAQCWTPRSHYSDCAAGGRSAGEWLALFLLRVGVGCSVTVRAATLPPPTLPPNAMFLACQQFYDFADNAEQFYHHAVDSISIYHHFRRCIQPGPRGASRHAMPCGPTISPFFLIFTTSWLPPAGGPTSPWTLATYTFACCGARFDGLSFDIRTRGTRWLRGTNAYAAITGHTPSHLL